MRQTKSVAGTLRSIGAAMKFSGKWDLVLHLKPWQGPDGEAREDELRVQIPATLPQRDRAFRDFKSGQILRVGFTRLAAPGSKPPPRAPAMLGWVAHGRFPIERVRASARLAKARSALGVTVVVRHPALGRVARRRGDDEFVVAVSLGAARRRELTIACSGRGGDDPDRDRRDVARAATLLAVVQRDLAKTLDAVTRKYLRLYNQTWRSDRPVLTRTAFLRQLAPSGLSVHPDGSATLWVDSADLFHDHAIEVRLNPRGIIKETGLA
jgi:hypothetical protein